MISASIVKEYLSTITDLTDIVSTRIFKHQHPTIEPEYPYILITAGTETIKSEDAKLNIDNLEILVMTKRNTDTQLEEIKKLINDSIDGKSIDSVTYAKKVFIVKTKEMMAHGPETKTEMKPLGCMIRFLAHWNGG